MEDGDISEDLMITLDAAKRDHAKSIRSAPLLRRKMLMAMAVEVSLQRNCAPSSVIRQIQNAEESKRSHQKHRFILKGPHPGRIKTILVPIPSLTQETIWEKLHEGIALKTLLEFNERHLTSSSISPSAHGPLHDAIKSYGGALITSPDTQLKASRKNRLDTPLKTKAYIG